MHCGLLIYDSELNLMLYMQFLLYMKEHHMLVMFSKAKFLDIYAGELDNGPPKKDPKVKMCEMLDVLDMFPKLMKLTARLEEVLHSVA